MQYLIAFFIIVGVGVGACNAEANPKLELAEHYEKWEFLHNLHLNVLEAQDDDLRTFELKKTSVINYKLFYWLLNDVYAQASTQARNSGICFFGGWLSHKSANGRCDYPWNHRRSSRLRSVAPSYNPSCGADDLFRCNPVIFGTGAGVHGVCVRHNNYNNITKSCNDATVNLRRRHFEQLKSNPLLRGQYLRTMKEISDFCKRSPSYSGCRELLANLQESGLEDCLGFDNVLPDSQKIEELANDVTTIMADNVQDEFARYSNSRETRNMIARLRTNVFKSSCGQRTCSGRKLPTKSTQYCWRYVKHGLMAGGFTNSYPSSAYAVNAGPVLRGMGFKNIKNDPKYSELLRDQKNIPDGAILVYSGGPSGAGHIEVKSGNDYLSDFARTGGVMRNRTLIGIYIK